MKQCFKCKKLKPLEEFYMAKSTKDKHVGKCKKCTIQDVKNRAVLEADKIAEYEIKRNKTEKRKLCNKKHIIEWRLKYPERYKAHTALNNAVRDGKIIRPSICEVCGKESSLHGHHHNYDFPLDVIWLCAECHAQIQ